VVNLATGAGPEFIGIYNSNAASERGSIGHFCLGVQNYDADRVMKTLTDQGVKARMRTRGESKEIFVTDPDNISVQLTDVSYCGEAVRSATSVERACMAEGDGLLQLTLRVGPKIGEMAPVRVPKRAYNRRRQTKNDRPDVRLTGDDDDPKS